MATYNLTSSIPSSSSLVTGDILNCPYSGTYKSITLPKGTYKLECWGAQGGIGSYSTNGQAGKGGYSYGTLVLSSSTTVYLYVGGQGGTGSTSATGGYNGGGAVTYSDSTANDCGGGGGASHIATSSGLLSSLSSSTSSILLVAGGGGGVGWNRSPVGGYGGGTTGGNGSDSQYTQYSGYGATQSNGGSASSVSSNAGSTTAGSFGQGGSGAGFSDGGAGGGGGYYGGGGATISAGGGGSGYVNTSKLTSASTIAGNTSFTSPTGASETGHSGDGYIRITVQSIISWAYSTVSISAPTYDKKTTSSWTLSPSACRYFSFTPTISGDFIVYSNSSIDTYGYLTTSVTSLNSSGQPSSYITSNDDDAKKYGGSGSNFGICYKVTAGTTYYIYVKPYRDSTASSSVYLTYYMAHPDSRVYVKTDSTTWKLITN